MVAHNIPLAVIGAAMLWFGWFGFNAGSALSAGSLAGNTLLVSQVASATSAMVWMVLSWRSKIEKPNVTAAITGAIAGLAGVTPLRIYQCARCHSSLALYWFGILLYGLASQAAPQVR